MVSAQRLTDEENVAAASGGSTMFNVPDVQLPAPGGGDTIPAEVRGKMESAFGQDFSDVRVHTGDAASSVGALAYTQGTDIHFQPGRYNPGSASGQQMLGHELAHVVQQRAGRVATPQGAGAPVNADPSLEAEADALGHQAARGNSITALAPSMQPATSAGSEVALQGAGIMDRIRGFFGRKKPDAAPAAANPAPAAAAAAANPVAAAAAPAVANPAPVNPNPAPVDPNPQPAANAAPEGAAAPEANPQELPDGAAAVAQALPPAEIAAAANAASALGGDAAQVIAAAGDQAAAGGAEANAGAASVTTAPSTPPPSSANGFAAELGIDLSTIPMPSTASMVGSAIADGAAYVGSGIASGARAVGGAAYDAGAWVGRQAQSGARAVADDPLTAGSIGGAVVGTGTSVAATATPYIDAASQGMGLGSTGQGWATALETNQTVGYGGGVGSVFGAASSLRDAGRAGQDLYNSNQSLSTDADTAALGLSSLGAAAGASASAARSIEAARLGVSTSQTVGNAVMAGAGTAAAGLSVATGSIDVIRGVAGAGLAESRRRELSGIEADNSGETSAGARLAAGNAASAQADRRNDRLITAGKGALSVAGGAILLAAGLTNPIGLGLLAGAALIGGGVALYRWWQGRKKTKDAAGNETTTTVAQQEAADRLARATELYNHRSEADYKRVLLAMGISEKKLTADKVTIADIEKALRPR